MSKGKVNKMYAESVKEVLNKLPFRDAVMLHNEMQSQKPQTSSGVSDFHKLKPRPARGGFSNQIRNSLVWKSRFYSYRRKAFKLKRSLAESLDISANSGIGNQCHFNPCGTTSLHGVVSRFNRRSPC